MGKAGELSKKGYQLKKCKGEAGSVGTLLLRVCVRVRDRVAAPSATPLSPFLAPGHEAGVPTLGFSERHSPGSQNVRGVTKQKLMNQLASRSAFSK